MADDTNTTKEDGPNTAPSGNDPATEGAAGSAASGGEGGAGAGGAGGTEPTGGTQGGTETTGGTETETTPAASDNATSEEKAKSGLQKILEGITSEGFGQNLDKLMAALTADGLSPEAKKKLLEDFRKADEERLNPHFQFDSDLSTFRRPSASLFIGARAR